MANRTTDRPNNSSEHRSVEVEIELEMEVEVGNCGGFDFGRLAIHINMTRVSMSCCVPHVDKPLAAFGTSRNTLKVLDMLVVVLSQAAACFLFSFSFFS